MQGSGGIGEFVDMDLLMVKRVFDARGRLGAIGHGDHDGRRFEADVCPGLCRLAPVVAEKVVAIDDEIRQRLLGLRLAVEVVFYFGIVIDVIEP